MAENRLVFVKAAVTTANKGKIDARALDLMQPGAMLLLMSRAAAADFPALTKAAATGRIRLATDVFPVEPLPPADPIRKTPNLAVFAPPRRC